MAFHRSRKAAPSNGLVSSSLTSSANLQFQRFGRRFGEGLRKNFYSEYSE